MGSKSAQNLTLMPNLLTDYVVYNLNLRVLDPWSLRGLLGEEWSGCVLLRKPSAHSEANQRRGNYPPLRRKCNVCVP